MYNKAILTVAMPTHTSYLILASLLFVIQARTDHPGQSNPTKRNKQTPVLKMSQKGWPFFSLMKKKQLTEFVASSFDQEF